MKLNDDVPEENFFILADGSSLKNLRELAILLKSMPDHVFSHHVNDYKNDFASWIKDVYKNDSLSKKLFSTKDRHLILSYLESSFNSSSRKKPSKKNLSSKKLVSSKKKLSSSTKKKLNLLEEKGVDTSDIVEGFFSSLWKDFKTFFSKDTISIVVQDIKSFVPKKK